MWTCRYTNKANLDYDGALESEQKILKLLERFPRYLEKPILQLVHESKLIFLFVGSVHTNTFMFENAYFLCIFASRPH